MLTSTYIYSSVLCNLVLLASSLCSDFTPYLFIMKFLVIILTLFTCGSIAVGVLNIMPGQFVPDSPHAADWLWAGIEADEDADIRASLALAMKNAQGLAQHLETLSEEEASSIADSSEFEAAAYISEASADSVVTLEGVTVVGEAATGLAVLGGAAVASIAAGGFVLAAIGISAWQIDILVKDIKHWNSVSLLRPLKISS